MEYFVWVRFKLWIACGRTLRCSATNRATVSSIKNLDLFLHTSVFDTFQMLLAFEVFLKKKIIKKEKNND